MIKQEELKKLMTEEGAGGGMGAEKKLFNARERVHSRPGSLAPCVHEFRVSEVYFHEISLVKLTRF